MATRLWTRTSCVSISICGEDLGACRAWARASQVPRLQVVLTYKRFRETEATNPWGGDSWDPQDYKHRRKHSKGGKNPGMWGPFPGVAQGHSSATALHCPLSLAGPGDILGETTGRLWGKCIP